MGKSYKANAKYFDLQDNSNADWDNVSYGKLVTNYTKKVDRKNRDAKKGKFAEYD